MELWEFWLLLMVTLNTIQNLIVFFVGRKFKKEKKNVKRIVERKN
jgi:hypothetical protein|tara:strand:+ start:178 stop:312 length:135 start_codon:yes stop_codon:yes gene_type:complete